MEDLGSVQGIPHLSYLLRLWLVQNQTHCVWRCSLENVQTGDRCGFASLEDLCAFLEKNVGSLPADDHTQDISLE